MKAGYVDVYEVVDLGRGVRRKKYGYCIVTGGALRKSSYLDPSHKPPAHVHCGKGSRA